MPGSHVHWERFPGFRDGRVLSWSACHRLGWVSTANTRSQSWDQDITQAIGKVTHTQRTLLSCITLTSSLSVGLCSSGSSVVSTSRLTCSALSLFHRVVPLPVMILSLPERIVRQCPRCWRPRFAAGHGVELRYATRQRSLCVKAQQPFEDEPQMAMRSACGSYSELLVSFRGSPSCMSRV